MKKGDLTPKQEKFCQEFAKHGNASEAYRVAYPVSLKWKVQSVWQKAAQTMALVQVKSRIAELKSEIAEYAKIEAVEGARIYRTLIAYGMESVEDEMGRNTRTMRDPAVALKATDSLMKLGGLFKEAGPSVSITNQVLIIDVSEKDA